MENRLSGEQGSLNEPDVSTRPEVVQILQDLLGNQDCAVFYLWLPLKPRGRHRVPRGIRCPQRLGTTGCRAPGNEARLTEVAL